MVYIDSTLACVEKNGLLFIDLLGVFIVGVLEFWGKGGGEDLLGVGKADVFDCLDMEVGDIRYGAYSVGVFEMERGEFSASFSIGYDLHIFNYLGLFYTDFIFSFSNGLIIYGLPKLPLKYLFL